MAELFVAGLVAAFGYYSAQRSSMQPRPMYADILDTHKDSTGKKPSDLVKDYAARAERRWKRAHTPQMSGIITPDTKPSDMMPFFRSGKSMNTNTQYKQRKMEMFTGVPNSSGTVWRHKVEVESMFPQAPQGVVTSAGTVGNPQGESDLQKARVVQGRVHHGIGPTETVRVGPGMGVGPEVQATGGFHQFYRQLPQNVNEYRLNTLPGGVNHGASVVQKRSMPVNHAVNKNPDALVWTLDDRPLAPSQAAVLARTADPNAPREYVRKRVNDAERFGTATVGGGSGTQVARTFTRPRAPTNAREFEPPVMNPSGTRAGVGGYTAWSRDIDMLPSQREQSVSHLQGGVKGAGEAAGTLRPMTQPSVTNRQLTETHTYRAPITGPRAERMDVIDKHPMKPTKREGQQRAHTNPAGRMNVFDPGHAGVVRTKTKPSYAGLQHTQAKAPVEMARGAMGARDRSGVKADPVNRHLNFGVAQQQLAQNPLHRDIAQGGDVWGGEPLPQLHIQPEQA